MPQKALTARIGDGGGGYEHGCILLVITKDTIQILVSSISPPFMVRQSKCGRLS